MTARRVWPAIALALLILPAAAHAAKPCPKGGKTLAVEKRKGKVTARVFRRVGNTVGCLANAGKVVKLGRDKPRLVELDASEVIWTVRGDDGTDRVSQADLSDGSRAIRNLLAVPAVTAGGERTAAAVDAVAVDDSGAFAWIAATGALVVGADGLSSKPAVTGPDGTERKAVRDRSVSVVDTLTDLDAAGRRAVVEGLRFGFSSGEGDGCASLDFVTWKWTGPQGAASATADVYRTFGCD